MMDSTLRSDLSWMLDELVQVPSVLHAVVVSADGLVIQRSRSLPQDTADTLAAGASSLYSVAAGIGKRFDSGPVQQIMTDYQGRVLFVTSAGRNARLAVLADQSVDMQTVGYEMTRLVTRIGQYLSSDARGAAPAPMGLTRGIADD